MPVFEYHGYDAAGKKSSGVIDADSARVARVKLRSQGVLATKLTVDAGRREFLTNPLATVTQRIGARQIASFTRQLATLQQGGLTMIESLDALIEQAGAPRLKRVVTDIREKVLQGGALADALAAHGDHFDPLYVNLVRAGESSGALDETLTRLAQFQEARLMQRSKMIAAMIYPLIMVIVGSGVLLFLLVRVTPQVETMFADMGEALPWATVVLLAVSRFLADWWSGLIVLVAGGGFVFWRWKQTPQGAAAVDRASLATPVFGTLIRNAAVARFARTLAVLLRGGVPLIESLKVTAHVVDNRLLSAAIDQAVVNITEGATIAAPLKASGLFPPLVTQMIAAGERSGSLTGMLEKIADAFDFEVEASLSALMAALEPLLILVMGLVVGFIVMAILAPIFELSTLSG
jgi:general secretion pathway protein F